MVALLHSHRSKATMLRSRRAHVVGARGHAEVASVAA